jgi:signal peptidase I
MSVAVEDERGQEGGSRLRRIGSELLILAAVVVVSLAARSALADHYYIPSESMEHSLLVGDRVVVDKTAYGLRLPFTQFKLLSGSAPRRGEIVVFDSPESGVRLIKRIVAVGGDEVSVRQGKLTINGKPIESERAESIEMFDDRMATLNLSSGGGPDMAPTVIPPGKVMVMGDNRGNSRDSRAFGFIPVDDIYGHAFRLYYRRGEGFVWRPV